LNELEIELNNIDPQEFFTNENISSLRSHFPKLKIVQRGELFKVLGEKKSLDDFNKKFKYLTNYYSEFNSLNPNVIDEIIYNDIKYNGKDKVSLILHGVGGKPILAKTKNQKVLVDMLKENQLVFAVGPAGTGKTYTGVAIAVKALKEKEIKKIILTRPAVEAGENLGYLPGDLKEKLDPYMQPLYDALRDMIPTVKLNKLLNDKVIEIAPLAFMRGRTLDNAFVILDEAQNTTPAQMKMFLTRMGMNAKFMVTGDPGQVDLPRNIISGLKDALMILKDKKNIGIVHLNDKDVMRHPIVKEIIDSYNKTDNQKNK
jgi:phosphate starvation-inducible PhoH-like protein|tara:strand:+ start:1442 stop:2386 length:945 start_codon:yes stop_codon:yes gene_type:complete